MEGKLCHGRRMKKETARPVGAMSLERTKKEVVGPVGFEPTTNGL